MTRNKLFAMLCSAVIMLTSWACTPPTPEGEQVLKVNPVLTELDHTAQSEMLGVDASGEWTATSSEEWLTLLSDAGYGTDVIEFEVEENTTADVRSAEIVVVMGELTATAYVEQAAAEFRVEKTQVELPYMAASTEIKIYSAEAWTAKTTAKWLTLEVPEETAGVESTLTINAEANNVFETRTAKVEVKSGDYSAIITVSQAKQTGDNFLVYVDADEFDVESTTLSPDIFGATYTINIGTPSSGLVWDAKTDDSFITLSNNRSNTGSGSFTAKVDFNNEGVREGTITLKGKLGSKNYELPIKVQQSYFTVTDTVVSLTAKPYGENLNWTITTEPALDIIYKSNADWLSIDGEGNITAEMNEVLAKSRNTKIQAVLALDTTVVAATKVLDQNALFTITIPLQCNTYITPLDPDKKEEPIFASSILPGAGSITSDEVKKGGQMANLKAWRKVHISSEPHQMSFYFRTEVTGELNLGMIGGLVWDDEEVADTAWLDIEIEDIRRRVMITNQIETYKSGLYKSGIDTVFLGEFNISKPGYVRVNLIPIDCTGKNLPYITDFALGGTGIANTTKKAKILSFVSAADVASSDPHWIMRGPSGNLSYDVPAYTEYFYNEIYVDKGYDFGGGYYMTTGGSAFYMGLQPNTPGNRTVLFSAWDTNTEAGQYAQVVRYGVTKPNNFGHEGSGQQTFLKYEWKAEKTYATMAHVRPEVDANGNRTGATLYTGYFWSEDDKDRDDETCAEGWHLVAEYRRPAEQVYYRGAHSFCENFSPYRGWIPRRVNFTNQWMIDKNGVWHEVTTAYLGVDGTGDSGMRKDFSGGVDERGFFYLTNIGYIDEYGKPGTKYTRQATGNKPNIPFEKLAKLGTWVK